MRGNNSVRAVNLTELNERVVDADRQIVRTIPPASIRRWNVRAIRNGTLLAVRESHRSALHEFGYRVTEKALENCEMSDQFPHVFIFNKQLGLELMDTYIQYISDRVLTECERK